LTLKKDLEKKIPNQKHKIQIEKEGQEEGAGSERSTGRARARARASVMYGNGKLSAALYDI